MTSFYPREALLYNNVSIFFFLKSKCYMLRFIKLYFYVSLFVWFEVRINRLVWFHFSFDCNIVFVWFFCIIDNGLLWKFIGPHESISHDKVKSAGRMLFSVAYGKTAEQNWEIVYLTNRLHFSVCVCTVVDHRWLHSL